MEAGFLRQVMLFPLDTHASQADRCVAPMQVSKEEEELIKQRLDVKRGLPLQDLSGNRGFPQ